MKKHLSKVNTPINCDSKGGPLSSHGSQQAVNSISLRYMPPTCYQILRALYQQWPGQSCLTWVSLSHHPWRNANVLWVLFWTRLERNAKDRLAYSSSIHLPIHICSLMIHACFTSVDAEIFYWIHISGYPCVLLWVSVSHFYTDLTGYPVSKLVQILSSMKL